MSRTTLFTSVVVALAASAPAGELMTPELLWKLGRVTAPRPSPDGKHLLFEVTQFDLAKNSGNADVHVLDLATGESRRLTTFEKSDSDAVWSPDGSRIAFVSSRDGTPQIWAMRVDGGEAVKLTSDPDGVANILWSPDGAHFAYTKEVRVDPELKDLYADLPLANARVIDRLLYRHWDAWAEGKYSHLFVVGADGSGARDLMPGERCHTPDPPNGDRGELAWSPDGKELCYTAKKVANPARSTDTDLYVVSLETGATRNITEGRDGFDRNPAYSPDGKWIAFLSMARPTFEADRQAVMLFDRATGAIRELSGGVDVSFNAIAWAPDSSGIYAEGVTRATGQVFRFDLAGLGKQLTTGRHDLVGVAVSPDGSTLYAQRSTTERPYEIVAFPAAGADTASIRALTHVNDAIYANLDLPTVEERIVRTKDGKDLFCWVVKPPRFDASKKYPLITYCQGGPQSPVSQFFSTRWNLHLMAARGYVVVAPNRRGCPSFGQAWTDAISNDWGGGAMQDYIDATDSMFTEPYVDRKRTAAVGASFGGYSVYWLMGHDQDDRFCTMIAHCGMFNTESWYGTTEELWFAEWDVGPPYWTGPDAQKAFDACSPHRFVGQWDTPLLVIHGEKDFRVPISEGIQAFQAAQMKGIPSRFLCFPEAGHWVSKPQDSVLWQRIFFDWLDRYCTPAR
ncbi:MAG: S9 family peptidase [Planctomycetes bacterium]|nr:S9 family peptidase [Planctomycetota bacterium]